MSVAIRTVGGMSSTEIVAGEDIREVMEVLSKLKWTESDDGSWTSHGTWGTEGNAFARALMRIDAELMTDEADLIGSPGHRLRTDDQRRADAFYELVMRIGDSLGRPRPESPGGC